MQPSEEEVYLANKRLQDAVAMKQFLESSYWKDLVEPVLDAMIVDILGGKEDGRWFNGTLNEVMAKDSEELKYRQAQKAALVNFHNMLYTVADGEEAAAIELEYLKNLK